MAIFTIDQEKCHKDGICAAVCPVGIIDIVKDVSFPQPSENAAEQCISCGHCSSACPHGALELEVMALASCPPSNPSLLPTSEQMTQLIRGRRSTRAYKNKPVEKKTIERLITLSRYAPSARNSQMLQWMVIDSPQELANLRGCTVAWMKDLVEKKDAAAIAYGFENVVNAIDDGNDLILRNAPGLVIIYAPKTYPYALIDGTIAMTTFELAASAENIGTCWAGFFMRAAMEWEPLRDALQLPEAHGLAAAMVFGHPKFRYARLPERKKIDIAWR
jgi:nitroreductase/NAD-dependent dihydropyrimidine dehydrogenase PreA subunit